MAQSDRTQSARHASGAQAGRNAPYHNYTGAQQGGPLRILASPKFAALVLAAAVLLGTLYGSHRSLNAIRPDYRGTRVEELFDRRGATARNLLAVAVRYDVDPGLLEKTEEVAHMLLQADEANERYDLFQSVENLSLTVIAALEAQNLAEKDSNYVASMRDELIGQDNQIRRSPYTREAQEFNAILQSEFPANLLGTLTGIQPAPVF